MTDGILGDLREEYASHVAVDSSARATLWYWRAILGIAGRFVFFSTKRATAPTHSPTNASGIGGRVLASGGDALRNAMRTFLRNPGFTGTVVGILALGIGANAIIFHAVDRLLISPPRHVSAADEVKLIHVRGRAPSGELVASPSISYPDFQDLRAVSAFADVAAYFRAFEETVDRGEAAHKARIVSVSPNLFELLGARPALGRFPVEDDAAAGFSGLAVLSFEYWQSRHGSDPDIIGRKIDVGKSFETGDGSTVIGIAPPGFTGARLAPVDVWLPAVPVRLDGSQRSGCFASRRCQVLNAVARLAPGIAVEAAEAEATARHRSSRGEAPAQDPYDANATVVLGSLVASRSPAPAGEVQVLRWVAGVSMVVLLIVCFNVVNLLLARSVWRQRDTALRVALGAGRARLVGDRVLEGLLLATMGAGAALLFASALGEGFNRLLLPDAALGRAGIGMRLIGFTVGIAVVSGIAAGAIPALIATRGNVADDLKTSVLSSSRGSTGIRTALVVSQTGLSVLLLLGAVLFVRSLRAAQAVDLGFDARRVAWVYLEWETPLPRPQAPNYEARAAERRRDYDRALERVRRLPGVHHAGLGRLWLLEPSFTIGPVGLPGIDSVPPPPSGGPYVFRVGPGYFEAMGLSVLQGRTLEATDDLEDALPVTLVSESMARSLWPNGDAVGACLRVASPDSGIPCTEVVGVVEDHRMELVEDEPHHLYYLTGAHPAVRSRPATLDRPSFTIMVGTDREAGAVIDLIRAEMVGASSRIRFVDAGSLSDFLEPQIRSWRLGAALFTGFGALGLVVAAWGLYGLLAFEVARRRYELGIRSALGAHAGRLIRMVLLRALGLVAAGLAIGLVAAVVVARFIEPLLFGVTATDPGAYLLVVATLLLAGSLAGIFPSLRATSVDPAEALRAE